MGMALVDKVLSGKINIINKRKLTELLCFYRIENTKNAPNEKINADRFIKKII